GGDFPALDGDGVALGTHVLAEHAADGFKTALVSVDRGAEELDLGTRFARTAAALDAAGTVWIRRRLAQIELRAVGADANLGFGAGEFDIAFARYYGDRGKDLFQEGLFVGFDL